MELSHVDPARDGAEHAVAHAPPPRARAAPTRRRGRDRGRSARQRGQPRKSRPRTPRRTSPTRRRRRNRSESPVGPAGAVRSSRASSAADGTVTTRSECRPPTRARFFTRRPLLRRRSVNAMPRSARRIFDAARPPTPPRGDSAPEARRPAVMAPPRPALRVFVRARAFSRTFFFQLALDTSTTESHEFLSARRTPRSAHTVRRLAARGVFRPETSPPRVPRRCVSRAGSPTRSGPRAGSRARPRAGRPGANAETSASRERDAGRPPPPPRCSAA